MDMCYTVPHLKPISKLRLLRLLRLLYFHFSQFGLISGQEPGRGGLPGAGRALRGGGGSASRFRRGGRGGARAAYASWGFGAPACTTQIPTTNNEQLKF